MKVNPNAPLYYVKTGRPVSIIEVAPVMKYRVQYANGNVAELTEAEMDGTLTNERPLFRFMSSFAAGHLIVRGEERHVQVSVRRKYADFPGQSLSHEDVHDLHRQLGQWLEDRRTVYQRYAEAQSLGGSRAPTAAESMANSDLSALACGSVNPPSY